MTYFYRYHISPYYTQNVSVENFSAPFSFCHYAYMKHVSLETEAKRDMAQGEEQKCQKSQCPSAFQDCRLALQLTIKSRAHANCRDRIGAISYIHHGAGPDFHLLLAVEIASMIVPFYQPSQAKVAFHFLQLPYCVRAA